MYEGHSRHPHPLDLMLAVSDVVVNKRYAQIYRRSRPSASGLDPEGEGRKLRWVFHFHCGWLAFKIIALRHWYWGE